MSFLDRLQPLGLLLMRIVLGVIMIAHSYQKIQHGVHNSYGFFNSLGLPWWSAYISTYTELIGGGLLILGLLTRVWSLGISIDMFVAIWKVHWKNGLVGKGGYEFPIACFALAFALIFFGAGPISLDAILFGRGGGGTKAKKA